MPSSGDAPGPRGIVRAAARFVSAPGRAVAVTALVMLLVMRLYDPVFVEEVRLRGFDVAQILSPRSYAPAPVRIVAIDEKSLAKYGQWPWSRTLVARLVAGIANAGPAALGVDILFVEPDRLSPQRLARSIPGLSQPARREMAGLPANEAALAAAFRSLPTVLGVGATFEDAASERPFRAPMVRQVGAPPRPFLFTFPALVRDLPEIDAAARSRAALVGNADRDGIVRRVPLFVMIEGHLLPSLSLETLRVAAHAPPAAIVASASGVKGAQLADRFLPTDGRAGAWLHFTPSLEGRYLSAADVLDGTERAAQQLNGAVVLLGVTGLGLVDVKQTPLGAMQGIEIHAQLIESMIAGSLLRRPAMARYIELALIAVAGLLCIFAFPYGRPRVAAVLFVGLAAIMLGGELVAVRLVGALVDGTFPALSATIMFGTMLNANLRAAEAARQRLADELQRERETKARIEGELDAARAIQMGLLPHRLPGPPTVPEIDVYAWLEPARAVGGDLYDVAMLDERRLFFAIADVSGKGVPAALFMAMSKEVLSAAVSRHGEALDRAFGEANAKICATSDDLAEDGHNMMFVTALACVLDLDTGALAFVSAGHDAPLLLDGSGRAVSVDADGGPPLGAMDGFHYPVEQRRLRPGDLLILFTDGVTEAESADGVFYGVERLTRLLDGVAPRDGARAAVACVRDDVARFTADAVPSDDVTLVAVRWLGRGNTVPGTTV